MSAPEQYRPRHRRGVRVDAPTVAAHAPFECPRCFPKQYAIENAKHRGERRAA